MSDKETLKAPESRLLPKTAENSKRKTMMFGTSLPTSGEMTKRNETVATSRSLRRPKGRGALSMFQRDESFEFMNRFDLDEIKSRLFSREGGASLNDEGIPFLIQQMKKHSLVKNNKTHRLRAERYDKKLSNARSAIKPTKNYILDKLKANERIFEREKNKKIQNYDYIEILDCANQMWLSQQCKDITNSNEKVQNAFPEEIS
jgi:hypothetical protein